MGGKSGGGGAPAPIVTPAPVAPAPVEEATLEEFSDEAVAKQKREAATMGAKSLQIPLGDIGVDIVGTV